jgi:DNA-binding NtrC family response regulator
LAGDLDRDPGQNNAGMGGEEVLAHMQAIEPKVPVILSTGYSEAETLLEEIRSVLSRTAGSVAE